jgi:hypothetical protein
MQHSPKGAMSSIAPRPGYASMTSLIDQIDQAGAPILVLDLAR